MTVLPALDASLLNTSVVTEVDLLRSLAKQVYGKPSKLPRTISPEFISNLVVAFGEKQLNEALFNPIAFAFSLLGEADSYKLITNITQAAIRVTPLSSVQVPLVQQLVASLDSSMNVTRVLMQQFLATLSLSQSRVIAALRQSTMIMLANRMTEPANGESSESGQRQPSSLFVKLIERETKQIIALRNARGELHIA
jgi:hypothetical protein